MLMISVVSQKLVIQFQAKHTYEMMILYYVLENCIVFSTKVLNSPTAGDI